MRFRAGKISTLIFQIASFAACLFLFSFLTANSSYALAASCRSLGGALTYSSCRTGQKAIRASDSNNYIKCCFPDPRAYCESKGGKYYNSYQNRVPNASYEQFPNLYPGHCFRVKKGCSANGSPQSAGCVCSANVSQGIFNGCKSNLACKSQSDGVRDTNGNSVYVTGNEQVYVTMSAKRTSYYTARVYPSRNATTYITKNVRNVEGICTAFPSGSPASGLSDRTRPEYNSSNSSCVKTYGGTCQYTDKDCFGVNGQYLNGKCPGPYNYKCCVRKTTTTSRVSSLSNNGGNNRPEYNSSNSSCVKTYGGTCQWDDKSCSGGYYISGKCPGPAHYRCCVRNSPKYN